MEKFEGLEMEVVAFDIEDIVTESKCDTETPEYCICDGQVSTNDEG